MANVTRGPRYLSVVLLSVGPAFLAANGCHFGAGDVSLGSNAPAAGGAPGSGGATGFAGNLPGGGEPAEGGSEQAGGMGAVDSEGGETGSLGGRGSGATGNTGGGGVGPGSGGTLVGGAAPIAGAGSLAAGGADSAGSSGASMGGASGTAGAGGTRPYGGAGTGSNVVNYWICGITSEPTAACGAPMGDTRYAFNPSSMACEERPGECDIPFQNRFGTEAECERNCADYAIKGIAGGPVPMTGAGDPAACLVPPAMPDCDIAPADGYAFFFDPRYGTCLSQPCLPESPNHFRSFEECEAACLPKFENSAADSTAVIEGSSCAGFGDLVSDSTTGDTFTLTGTVLSRDDWWGCGCPTRAELVMVYEPTSPLRLRLCDDMFASACAQACNATLEWDLAAAFEVAQTTEFVFVD